MRTYKGATIKIHRHDLTKIGDMLRNKLGEYTEDDFETFLQNYSPKMQKKIREIEKEIRIGEDEEDSSRD